MVDNTKLQVVPEEPKQELFLPVNEDKKDDGFIPVPADGSVPRGSDVRIDMSSGEKMYKPPKVVDDVRDHKDYVDMDALRKLHEKMKSAPPAEVPKWEKKFEMVRKDIEDLLISLSDGIDSALAVQVLEKLEDAVIESIGSANGIFKSKLFINLVKKLVHDANQVRAATASMLFYAIQNNQVAGEAFLSNSPVLKIFKQVFDQEKNDNVVYKCVSIIEAALTSCSNSEKLVDLVTILKESLVLVPLQNVVNVNSVQMTAEKVVSIFSMVASKTFSNDDLAAVDVLLDSPKVAALPKGVISKLVSPLCSHANEHFNIKRACKAIQ